MFLTRGYQRSYCEPLVIDLFTFEWVINSRILTPNNSRFYASRIHDQKGLLNIDFFNLLPHLKYMCL